MRTHEEVARKVNINLLDKISTEWKAQITTPDKKNTVEKMKSQTCIHLHARRSVHTEDPCWLGKMDPSSANQIIAHTNTWRSEPASEIGRLLVPELILCVGQNLFWVEGL